MLDSPVILAIDTSLGPCSVALWQGGAIAAEESESAPGSQSRVLVPMIEAVLARAGVDYDACTAIACTIGPGGFTGIRTGLASAQAIALATDKPLIGLSTLEVIAFAAKQTGDVLAIIDAYRGQWYAQRFRSAPSLVPLSDALLVYENNIKSLAHGANIVQSIPHAKNVAALAHDKWMRGERQFPITPLYIREPDAKLPA